MTDYLDDKVMKATSSTILLMPCIGMNRRSLRYYGFLNAYLDDSSYEIHYENSLYLLFKPEPPTKIAPFAIQQRENPLLVDEYDYKGGYTIMVYKIIERWIPEYKLFKLGKYSKFSEEYKALFPKYVEVIDRKTGKIEQQIGLPYHIFNKSEALKTMRETQLGMKLDDFGPEFEYWSIPDIGGKETLNIDKIEQYEQIILNTEQ